MSGAVVTAPEDERLAITDLMDRVSRTPLDYLKHQWPWQLALATLLVLKGGHASGPFTIWTPLRLSLLVLCLAALLMLPTMALLGARLRQPKSPVIFRVALGSMSTLAPLAFVLAQRFGNEQTYSGLCLTALGYGFFWFYGHWLGLLMEVFALAVGLVRRYGRALVLGTSVDGTLRLPPCSRARRLLAFLFTAKTMTHIYDPVIADNQSEWFEAESTGKRRQAQWIRLRGYLILLKVVLVHGMVGLVRLAVELFKTMKG